MIKEVSVRFFLLCLALAVAVGAHGQQRLDGRWAGVFQQLDNGEDNTLHMELHQDGGTLNGKFKTIGYGGALRGTIADGKFVLFAPWDKVKPFCHGTVETANLVIDLGWGKPFPVHPEGAADVPPAPAYIPPPALHKVPGNHLAKTPPMGWNSWNHFASSIDDAKVRAAADEMVASGMRDAGYVYINIDDTWEGVRDADGVLQPNHKFPDMKALADYVHSKGLKLGIYSSPGLRTCGGYPGSYGHESQDAKTWASWGIDFLKYDWCSAAEIYKDADLQPVYQRMGDALLASGRPIVYSLCEYGTNHVENWGADVGGNLWRTTGDIRDEYASMAANGFSDVPLAPAAGVTDGTGHWNDPDMLEVGNGKMTFDEYKTHMSLWSLLASPLLAGNDLSKMSAETKEILLNRDVIAIDQDALGRQATRLYRDGEVDVWSKSLADGGTAVGVFNRGTAAVKPALKLAQMKLDGKRAVLDTWTHRAVVFTGGEQVVSIPAHGVLLLRVSARMTK